MDFLHSNLEKYKLRKLTPIPGSTAFHTKLMEPAAEVFRNVLKTIEMSESSAYIYLNVDAKRHSKPNIIRKLLPKEICKPVLWEQTLHTIYQRDVDTAVPSTFICGPKALYFKNILKQISHRASKHCGVVVV